MSTQVQIGVKMTSIELMMDEHKKILRMLEVVRRACTQLMEQDIIDYSDFEKMVDFIKNYADLHHHGKEEKFLFKEMQEQMGQMGTNLVKHGMLVEHDWGRLFVSELLAAIESYRNGNTDAKIDIIANAIGYTAHLKRHIAKEDAVVYVFAGQKLSQETLERVDKLTDEFEAEAMRNNIQKKYDSLLTGLEEKYLP